MFEPFHFFPPSSIACGLVTFVFWYDQIEVTEKIVWMMIFVDVVLLVFLLFLLWFLLFFKVAFINRINGPEASVCVSE